MGQASCRGTVDGAARLEAPAAARVSAGGIYGPERSALDVAARGRDEGRRARQRYTARVHVGDACRVLAASMAHPAPGTVYNVVDDDPAPRGVVVGYARGLLGVQEDHGIRFEAPAEERGVEEERVEEERVERNVKLPEKRVSNARIKQDLGVALRYPTYREGLQAVLREDPDPFFYVASDQADGIDYMSSPSFF